MLAFENYILLLSERYPLKVCVVTIYVDCVYFVIGLFAKCFMSVFRILHIQISLSMIDNN